MVSGDVGRTGQPAVTLANMSEVATAMIQPLITAVKTASEKTLKRETVQVDDVPTPIQVSLLKNVGGDTSQRL